MAFPANLNINYYRGDTYEFKAYPKFSSGESFDLSGYDRTNGVKFTISTDRGPQGVVNSIEAFSEISLDRTHITCAIRPGDGNQLDPSRQYVYDVEISKPGTPYDSVFTILTGNIFVTDQVTGATSE
jgi:hypothetical protein